MRKFLHLSLAGSLLAATLAGCSPEAIRAVAAAAADGRSDAAKPAGAADRAAKPAGDTAAKPAGDTATKPTGDVAEKPAADEPAAEPSAARVLYDKFVAKADEAKDDSRMTGRLFVWAFCYYAKDPKLAKAMMSYLTYKDDLRMNPESLSGYDFTSSRSFYWNNIDKNPARMFVHLKNGEADLADLDKGIEGVIIDDDYAAAQKGEWDSATYTKEAKYYIFTFPVGKIRPRPVALIIEDG
ncbi:MAG: hypothetical protein VKQ33_05185, partial [Candidatus Sericytochromatia bacterium]|nr:hypothetical protein [Candidatus Sericytochromatia bacterium]